MFEKEFLKKGQGRPAGRRLAFGPVAKAAWPLSPSPPPLARTHTHQRHASPWPDAGRPWRPCGALAAIGHKARYRSVLALLSHLRLLWLSLSLSLFLSHTFSRSSSSGGAWWAPLMPSSRAQRWLLQPPKLQSEATPSHASPLSTSCARSTATISQTLVAIAHRSELKLR
jgi:hypothetical protein